MTTIKIKKGFRVPGTNVMVESGDVVQVREKQVKRSIKEESYNISTSDLFRFVGSIFGNGYLDVKKAFETIQKFDCKKEFYDLVTSYKDEGFDIDLVGLSYQAFIERTLHLIGNELSGDLSLKLEEVLDEVYVDANALATSFDFESETQEKYKAILHANKDELFDYKEITDNLDYMLDL